MLNFLPIQSYLPFRKCFAYIDIHENNKYYGDRIFEKYQIPVKFKTEYTKNEDSRYKVIICSIPKKYEPEFIKALKELHNTLLIMGDKTYTNLCNKFEKESVKK